MLLRARAIENQYYVAAAGQVGETIAGTPAYGRSLIVDPWGTVLAQAPDEETVSSPRSTGHACARSGRSSPPREPAARRVPVAGARVTPRGVLFDVDFTLARPGPELGPEGYVRAGARHGLVLDASRYDEAREAAFVS